MAKYAGHVSRKKTPQSEAIPGKVMVQNQAGGYSFPVDNWTRLHRFLVLGNSGGSYYASERKMTKEAAQAVEDCANEDFDRTLATVVEISDQGRAPKNDEALFALALLCSRPDPAQSGKALAELNKVARIGTHLFQFMGMLSHFRGRGRAVRRAVGNWYLGRRAKNLAYQVTKYQQREGWSHRDVLRCVKPKTEDAHLDGVLAYTTGKDWRSKLPEGEARDYLNAVEQAKVVTDKRNILQLIEEHGLVREVIPTQWFKDPEVWAAMLPSMPLNAMMRNLGKMSQVGLITPMGSATQLIVSKLTDPEYIKASRLHPFNIMNAMYTYRSGRGFRGQLSWNVDNNIGDALEDAFYMAFDNVVPTGKRHLLALDVSGSMGCAMQNSQITCRDATAALAMVTTKTEAWTHCIGFSAKTTGRGWFQALTPKSLLQLDFSRKMRLDTAIKKVSGLPFGGTDCSLPILYALENKIEADAFVVYTDSETWAGNIQPVQALEQYRQKTGIPAKLIVVGMVSNGFSIADPNDAGMLDIVGFDTSAPAVMSEFIRG